MCHKCLQKFQTSQQTEFELGVQGVVGALKAMYPNFDITIVGNPFTSPTESVVIKYAEDLLTLVDSNRGLEWTGIAVSETIQSIPGEYVQDVITEYCGTPMPFQIHYRKQPHAVLYGLVMADVMTKVSRNQHEENIEPKVAVIDGLLIASLEKMIIDFISVPNGKIEKMIDNIDSIYHQPLLERLIKSQGLSESTIGNSQEQIRKMLITIIELMRRDCNKSNKKLDKEAGQGDHRTFNGNLSGSPKMLYKELSNMIAISPHEVTAGHHVPFIEMMNDEQVKGVIQLVSSTGVKEQTVQSDRAYLIEICITLANERITALDSMLSSPVIKGVNLKSPKTEKQKFIEIWNKDPDVSKFINFVNELNVNQLSDYLEAANGNLQVARYLLVREITGRSLMLVHFVK